MYVHITVTPSHVLLTVSNNDSDQVNSAMINEKIKEIVIFTHLKCTVKQKEFLTYNGVPIMPRDNRDKYSASVNGQICCVHSIQGTTLLAKDPDGHIINIYLVTDPETMQTYYPFQPCYSCTIAKVQGQTLTNIVLWEDTPLNPLWIPPMWLCWNLQKFSKKICWQEQKPTIERRMYEALFTTIG